MTVEVLAPAVAIVPARISSFGPKIEFGNSLDSIVNEGPVPKSFFKEVRPITPFRESLGISQIYETATKAWDKTEPVQDLEVEASKPLIINQELVEEPMHKIFKPIKKIILPAEEIMPVEAAKVEAIIEAIPPLIIEQNDVVQDIKKENVKVIIEQELVEELIAEEVIPPQAEVAQSLPKTGIIPEIQEIPRVEVQELPQPEINEEGRIEISEKEAPKAEVVLSDTIPPFDPIEPDREVDIEPRPIYTEPKLELQPELKVDVVVETETKPHTTPAISPHIDVVKERKEPMKRIIPNKKPEAIKNERQILGEIIFRKDEAAASFRLSRAKEELRALYEKKKDKVLGEQLNDKLGDEIRSEKSALLPQLGLEYKRDGTNIPGFRKTLRSLVFESVEDGDKKIDEASQENIPVMIGGDGIVLTDEHAERVLQEEGEALIRIRAELAKASVSYK